MPEVTLYPISSHNWKACASLKLAAGQEAYLPENLYSIAEAQFYPDGRSRAIYSERGEMIGYALYGRDPFTNRWKICRIMIDADHQGMGYGKAAMRKIIAEINREADGDVILICYHESNTPARSLYRRLGFMEQCLDDTGMITAVLRTETATRPYMAKTGTAPVYARLEELPLPA